MPLITVFFLLGISSVISRPMLLGGFIADLIVRFLICIWFCGLYIRLSRFSKYHLYPNIKWSKTDVGSTEKLFYFGVAIFLGLGCTIVTWWTLKTFLPVFSHFVLITAIINGLLISLPIMAQYWIIKL
jgi:hypothetical protein